MMGCRRVLPFVLASLLVTGLARAEAEAPARIALVIDDVGYQWDLDRALLELDPRVALAIIPEGPHAPSLARMASEQQREVMVHLPLGGLGYDNCRLALTCIGMDWDEGRIREHLIEQLRRVPGAIGLNNHQGSHFTGNEEAVRRLVGAIVEVGDQWLGRSLIVLDSRTVPGTKLESVARSQGLAALRRRVFLDHDNAPEAIASAWQDLIDLARYHGSAIAIGHPRPNTLAFLRLALPSLEAEGVELVTISDLAASLSAESERATGTVTAP